MKTQRALITLIIGLFFILDRFFKWQALHAWASDRLIYRWLGWHPFFNPGVAFGIPVPTGVVVALTVPILFLLGYLLASRNTYHVAHSTNEPNGESMVTCYALVFAGALSNLIDRIVYGHTVDYVLIFTGVINLADVMIVGGFVVYFFMMKSKISNTSFLEERGGE